MPTDKHVPEFFDGVPRDNYFAVFDIAKRLCGYEFTTTQVWDFAESGSVRRSKLQVEHNENLRRAFEEWQR